MKPCDDKTHTTPREQTAHLSDRQLIRAVARLAARERGATADLIRSLIEFDARRLYLGEGYSSLFTYCTAVLHYSEHAALNRIEVARAAQRWPELLDHIRKGSIHLSGARILAPHLTDENCRTVLESARGKSKRRIEELTAALSPRTAAAPSIRRLPAARSREDVLTSSSLHDHSRSLDHGSASAVSPVSAEHYRMHITITRDTREKLRRAQDLLRRKLPDGDPAVIFDQALTALLAQLERKRFAATTRPVTRPVSVRPSEPSRHVPAAVKRKVWKRDGGQCAFLGTRGRCGERSFLEFHHVVPFASGGDASVENIELRCRAHNAYEAALAFGIEQAQYARNRDQPSGG